MSHQQRSRSLRLEVGVEASALISIWGSAAYSVALQRAEEASSQELANDWDGVARAIERRSGKRSLLNHLFH
jgi:hypothetical protein